MHRIATLVSRIFDPFLVFLVLMVFVVRQSTLLPSMQINFFFAALILMIGAPVGLVVLFIRNKRITNWDMSVRSERPRAFAALFIIELISMFVLQRFADPSIIVFFRLFIVWLIGFTGITLIWKISGHSGVNALVTGYIVARLGISWWPILLIVPLVGWARVVRKDHTVLQVIAGALYSWALVLLMSWK